MRSVPGLAAAMTVAMGAGPLLVYALSTLSPLLITDLGLSRLQYGVLGSLTYAAAGLASVTAGRVVDSSGVWRVMWILIAGTVGAIFAATIAPSYPVLIVAVLASGLVQATSNPVTNRLAAQWLPPASRGVVMGIKQSGVQIMQTSAGLFLPALAVVIGWRGAMAVIAGVVVAVGATLIGRYVPRDRVPYASAPGTRQSARLPRSVWWLTGYMFLTGAAMQGVNFYLPLFAYEDLGLAIGTAGLLVAIIGGFGIAARIAWGRITDHIGSRIAMPIVALGGACAAGLILVSSGVNAHLVWAGAFVIGATAVAANVVVMVTVIHAVPAGAIGRATGVVATGMYAGFAIGPVSVGALVDATGTYSYAWAAISATYLIALISALGYSRQGQKDQLAASSA